MYESKQKADWVQTSEIIAALYNTIRDPKRRKKPFTGNDFNPTLPRKAPVRQVSISEWAKLARADEVLRGSQRQ